MSVIDKHSPILLIYLCSGIINMTMKISNQMWKDEGDKGYYIVLPDGTVIYVPDDDNGDTDDIMW